MHVVRANDQTEEDEKVGGVFDCIIIFLSYENTFAVVVLPYANSYQLNTLNDSSKNEKEMATNSKCSSECDYI